MFGPHRCKRIVFLVKNDEKTLPNGMGGSVFGPHRRQRIAFLGKCGEARVGRFKKGSGALKKRIVA